MSKSCRRKGSKNFGKSNWFQRFPSSWTTWLMWKIVGGSRSCCDLAIGAATPRIFSFNAQYLESNICITNYRVAFMIHSILILTLHSKILLHSPPGKPSIAKCHWQGGRVGLKLWSKPVQERWFLICAIIALRTWLMRKLRSSSSSCTRSSRRPMLEGETVSSIATRLDIEQELN